MRQMPVSISDKMEQAIRDVLDNGMSVSAAARTHGVARTTLTKRLRRAEEAEAPRSNKHTEVAVLQEDSELMKNFKAEKSKRNQKKQVQRRQLMDTPQRVYDREGRLLSTGLDVCDCLTPDCVGCFFACSSCRSHKCGHECRQNRKWTYNSYEVQGMAKNNAVK